MHVPVHRITRISVCARRSDRGPGYGCVCVCVRARAWNMTGGAASAFLDLAWNGRFERPQLFFVVKICILKGEMAHELKTLLAKQRFGDQVRKRGRAGPRTEATIPIGRRCCRMWIPSQNVRHPYAFLVCIREKVARRCARFAHGSR